MTDISNCIFGIFMCAYVQGNVTNSFHFFHIITHPGRHFADDIFKCIFLNEKVCISLKISLKFVPKV